MIFGVIKPGFDACCGEKDDAKVCDWPENGAVPLGKMEGGVAM